MVVGAHGVQPGPYGGVGLGGAEVKGAVGEGERAAVVALVGQDAAHLAASQVGVLLRFSVDPRDDRQPIEQHACSGCMACVPGFGSILGGAEVGRGTSYERRSSLTVSLAVAGMAPDLVPA